MVVYIDISDVQDEAIYQEFEGTIINKHILDFQDFMIKDKSFERKIKDLVKKNFPFVYSKLHKIKQKVSLEENNFKTKTQGISQITIWIHSMSS